MATVLFWEKPGCVSNTRQKALLHEAGHTVIARDLRAEVWTRERLRRFFGDLPVADWFNPSAPAVKAGRVVPERLDEAEALDRMLQDPLLIRRPLMQVDGRCAAGFDLAAVHAWIGLATDTRGDLETCPRDAGQASRVHRGCS